MQWKLKKGEKNELQHMDHFFKCTMNCYTIPPKISKSQRNISNWYKNLIHERSWPSEFITYEFKLTKMAGWPVLCLFRDNQWQKKENRLLQASAFARWEESQKREIVYDKKCTFWVVGSLMFIRLWLFFFVDVHMHQIWHCLFFI